MHICRLHARGFKRFHDLTIEIPGTPRLVVLAGPNGMGKSSLIDAVRLWHGTHGSGEGFYWDDTYHQKSGDAFAGEAQMLEVEFTEAVPQDAQKKLVYARSAYRHEPDFSTTSIQQTGDLLDAQRVRRMIDPEGKVSDNYQRLISATLNDLYLTDDGAATVASIREKHIGKVRDAMSKLFPELVLQGPGNPLGGGTFFFRKAGQPAFHYKNLSGGEKAAFDLILDLVIKGAVFDNTVFFIDEPELHLNTRVQGSLLDVLLELVPSEGQLWIATHAIGIMRRAQEMTDEDAGSVAFLDFEGHDFDQPVTLSPTPPDRLFWSRVLAVALGDMASLVAPDRVVLCEGRPAGAGNVAKAEFDARCYRKIFAAEFPRTDFLSVGNATDVSTDRVEIGRAIQTLVTGTSVVRVVDRDLRSPQEIQDLEAAGIRVLSRRHLEAFLLDDEVLNALCESVGHHDRFPEVFAARQDALQASVARGNDADDAKSAAGEFYVAVRQLLQLTQGGSTTESFLADTLAPLLKPGMAAYESLRWDVVGE